MCSCSPVDCRLLTADGWLLTPDRDDRASPARDWHARDCHVSCLLTADRWLLTADRLPLTTDHWPLTTDHYTLHTKSLISLPPLPNAKNLLQLVSIKRLSYNGSTSPFQGDHTSSNLVSRSFLFNMHLQFSCCRCIFFLQLNIHSKSMDSWHSAFHFSLWN